MSDILCVTNRSLCKEDFLVRIEKIAKTEAAGIILREKDLSEEEYQALAEKILTICQKQKMQCILHTHKKVARKLAYNAIHLPMPILRTLPEKERDAFQILGASCHSLEEAVEAEKLGCTYITAGHIYETDCKKGLPGRGIGFLKKICETVSIPVYAIGGINPENICEVKKAGAAGGCIMSGWMQCEDVREYLKCLKHDK
ncbi:MAG TPA: thiamine phosphate synthase [Lachnospiraceae bacterium]|nr:thiamine phosphate synthase [Lachnospiraceae bacterium]